MEREVRSISLINILERNNSVKTSLTGVLPAEKVLVMAPHHDDEVVGCGGSILRYLDIKTDVTIAYLTDGRYGVIGKNNDIRRKEAIEAWKDYLVEQVFWDFEDSHMDKDCVQKEMIKLISDLSPDVIFVPWPLDRHIDHKMTGFYLAEALEGLNNENIMICSYEVMYPLYANKIVDITNQIDNKLEIMSAYKSQIQYLNLEQLVKTIGLQRAYTTQLKSVKSAEAFFVCDYKGYVDFIKKVFS